MQRTFDMIKFDFPTSLLKIIDKDNPIQDLLNSFSFYFIRKISRRIRMDLLFKFRANIYRHQKRDSLFLFFLLKFRNFSIRLFEKKKILNMLFSF